MNIKKYANSPLWPALLSAFVAPGAGQIFNRDFKRGILLLVISIGGFFWFSTILTQQLAVFLSGAPEVWVQNPVLFKETVLKVVEKNPDMFVTFYALMILTWGFGVIDAYLSARKSKKNHLPSSHEDVDPLR